MFQLNATGQGAIRCPALLLIVLCFAAALTHASGALAAPAPLDRLTQALAEGDVNKANEAVRAMPPDDNTSKMVQAQLAYDLPTVLKSALVCRDQAFGQKQPSAAAACNKVAYRAALVLGDAHTVFVQIAWMKRIGYPAMGRPPMLGNAFDHVDVDKLAKTLPTSSATMANGAASIPYTNAAFVSGNEGAQIRDSGTDLRATPTIAIEVNHNPTEAKADTGLGYSVVMDQAHADALGVKPLVMGLAPLPTIGRAPVGDSLTLGWVEHLNVGPLTLRNTLVLVVPSGNPLTDRVLIGMPVLARFRQFTFEQSALVVGKPARCDQPLPLSFASSWDETGKLVFEAKADGSSVKASIDTGLAPSLVAGSPLIPGGSDPGRITPTSSRYLKIDLGNVQVSDADTQFIPTLTTPAVLIGAPVLATSDLHFNFEKPALCVVHRSREKKPR
jgi:predicted aspartyl protease